MKLELKKNMYVRTKDGIIAKILNIKDGYAWCDNVLEKIPDEGYNFYENDYFNIDNEVDLGKIKKASYNIIDILEVGDYVNGSWVNEFVDNKPIHKDYNDLFYSFGWENEEIKTVITHEQIEQMAYKVVE